MLKSLAVSIIVDHFHTNNDSNIFSTLLGKALGSESLAERYCCSEPSSVVKGSVSSPVVVTGVSMSTLPCFIFSY
jgi:hypothetical protein